MAREVDAEGLFEEHDQPRDGQRVEPSAQEQRLVVPELVFVAVCVQTVADEVCNALTGCHRLTPSWCIKNAKRASNGMVRSSMPPKTCRQHTIPHTHANDQAK